MSDQPGAYSEWLDSQIPVLVTHDVTLTTIIDAFSRLPSDVRAWVLEHCWFASVGEDDHAQMIPAGTLREYQTRNLVILRDIRAADIGEEGQSSVAHEIAHAWLGHQTSVGKSDDEDAADEQAAANRAAAWGFTGRGARWPQPS